jgi:hypothetical protein
VHILCYAKVFVGIEELFAGKFALSVFIVASDVPHWVGAVCVGTYVVGYISNDQLGFGYAIDLVVLEMVVEELYHIA